MFEGLRIDGALGLRYTPAPARLLVAIGDSIIAGYGNEDQGPYCPFSPRTENGYETFTALAARRFGAEYEAAAVSGIGVHRNRDPGYPPTMRDLWTRTLPDNPSSEWTFARRADLVVVNLGTNDFAYGAPERNHFVGAYRELLWAIRARYPEAQVIVSLGPMFSDNYPHGERHLTTVRAYLREVVDSSGPRVRFLEHRVQGLDGEPLGCDWHPSIAVHRRMADELVAEIRALTGWD